ncbi:MAG: DUF998 domain-containing protein [Solirubrobacteraceae bacterium]
MLRSGPRSGPVLWLLSAQYFAVQVIVAAAWERPYSWSANAISDLGNTRCARFSGRSVCSPLHLVMNASFVLLGLSMFAGAVLIGRRLAAGRAAETGFAFMALAGVGTVLVGLFPENTVGLAHVGGAALPFVLGNLGLLVLGLSLPELPAGLRASTLAAGAVGVGGLALFLGHAYLGVGLGGMERVAAYPQDVWLIAFGGYLLARPAAGVAR